MAHVRATIAMTVLVWAPCALSVPTTEAADKRFEALLSSEWARAMRDSPETATWVGYPGRNDRLTDRSQAAIAAQVEHERDFLQTLHGLKRAALSPANQLNYDLAVREREEDLEGVKFHGELMPINQLGGVQQDLAQLLADQPAQTQDDYRDIIARLRAVPKLIDQTIALLADGMIQGITPPQVTLRDVPDQIKAQIVTEPSASPMLRAFQKMPETIPQAAQKSLRQEAEAAYKDAVAPAFAKLLTFFTETYLPKARTTISMAGMPNGRAWYAYNARVSTTTTMTPEEIHGLGLAEVKRIRGAMDEVIKSVKFDGDFAAFGEFLRTDPRFVFTDKMSLLAAYRDIAKRIDPELPRLFGKLPRLTYGVKPVPEESEKSQPTGYYQPGSIAARRPGNFYANTYDLPSRPKWGMEALTLHEAVPGHHLQIALAQEQGDLPEFRKHSGYQAYTEGWGLYAESLGSELGLYQDPYAKYGQLTYEMWRAVRLVVDTGIHYFGWSREQAIDYFKANTGKSEHDIVVEVDRYIVWPGQALAYKIGELKIKGLRAEATAQLGERFDERAFHDEVLSSGAVPLDVLEKRIRAWIDGRKRLAAN